MKLNTFFKDCCHNTRIEKKIQSEVHPKKRKPNDKLYGTRKGEGGLPDAGPSGEAGSVSEEFGVTSNGKPFVEIQPHGVDYEPDDDNTITQAELNRIDFKDDDSMMDDTYNDDNVCDHCDMCEKCDDCDKCVDCCCVCDNNFDEENTDNDFSETIKTSFIQFLNDLATKLESNSDSKTNNEKTVTDLTREYEDECYRMRTRYEDECYRMKRNYEDECHSMKRKYEDEQCSKKEYEDECSRMKQKYEDECSMHERSYEDECSRMKKSYEDECSKMGKKKV